MGVSGDHNSNNLTVNNAAASILDDEVGVPDDACFPPSGTLTASLWSNSNNDQQHETTDPVAVIRLDASTCLRQPAQNGRSLVVGRHVSVPTSVDTNSNSKTTTTRRNTPANSLADIRIQHKSMSRKHAVFYYQRSIASSTEVCWTLRLKDLGSKYGTTVNGQRIATGNDDDNHNNTIVLQHGDTIVFGNVRETVFRVHWKHDPTIAPTSLSTATTATTTIPVSVDSQSVELATNDPHRQPLPDTTPDILERAGQGLTGRAKRQAEIAAMMATLDQTPHYHQPQLEEPLPDRQTAIHHHNDNTTDDHLSITAENRNNNNNSWKPPLPLPVSQRLVLASESERHNETTCLAMDPSGARFVVGGRDTMLRFYDFGGMDQSRTGAFQSVLVDDGHWLVDVCYSNTGDRILVGTGSVQPKVLTRDGEEILQFVRGDMYVTDQAKTKGHTAAVTGVSWHPLERDLVLTSSLDGSARLWNLNGKTSFSMLVCDKVFLVKNERGQRTAVTVVCFHPGGREFAVGTACGSVQIWNRHRVAARPERAVYNAHGKGNPVYALCYNADGSQLLSRSPSDDTAKAWNAQRLSRSAQPTAIFRGLSTIHDRANAVWSPDGNFVCAGSAEVQKIDGKRREVGALHWYQLGLIKNKDSRQSMGAGTTSSLPHTLDPVHSIDMVDNAAPVVVNWHARLNQIVVGCSDGSVSVFYDPTLSSKGALMPASKVSRGVDSLSELLKSKAPTGSAAFVGEIVTPFASSDGTNKKKRKFDEPVHTMEPERPTSGKHKTGSQAGGVTNFQQFVADQTQVKGKVIAGRDPREALLQYQKGKSYLGKETKILAEKTAEEEEEESKAT